ncbi:hypothetical protein ACGF3C_10950 [Micromonospora sp. NPDC047762]|uniref:hypothetical protein n=1 Tax=Micromonospora sp. NPDC047762 TaxID=3364255 RepID=UPI00371E9F74
MVNSVEARSRRKALVVGLLVTLAATGGCDDGGSARPRAVTTSPIVGAPATSSPPPAVDSLYDATNLDLCRRTDLAPLADLSVKVARTDPKPPLARQGSSCLFAMRTADDHQANLLVEASSLTSAEEAGRLYTATQQVTAMTADGFLADVGEEAEGFVKRSDPGFKYTEYMVHARGANLVVKVWLAVGGDSYLSKQVLAAKALAILKATYTAVPHA